MGSGSGSYIQKFMPKLMETKHLLHLSEEKGLAASAAPVSRRPTGSRSHGRIRHRLSYQSKTHMSEKSMSHHTETQHRESHSPEGPLFVVRSVVRASTGNCSRPKSHPRDRTPSDTVPATRAEKIVKENECVTESRLVHPLRKLKNGTAQRVFADAPVGD